MATNQTKKKTTDESAPAIATSSAEAVNKTESTLNSHLESRPDSNGYSGTYKNGIDDTLSSITNREQFSYNPDGDALYRQYKNSYQTAGKQAMQDTIGQASTLTGGYANSYAQTAGQQSYNAQMQKLTDMIPELYALAYTKYSDETKNLYDRYNTLSDVDDTQYGRYRDTVTDWYTDASMLYEAYTDARDFNYNKDIDERDFDYNKDIDVRDFNYNKDIDDRDFVYTQSRDTMSDSQWEREYNEGVRRYDTSLGEDIRQYDQSLAAKAASSSSSSSSSSGSSSSKSSSSSSSSSRTGSDVASALSDVGYTPNEQKTIMTMLETYRADYDNAAGNLAAQNYAINLALAYLSGLEHTGNNAYIFEKVFGFSPPDLSNEKKEDTTQSKKSGGGFYV